MKCLHNGYFKIQIVISAEFAQHITEQAQRCGCFGPDDYATGVLNMELTREIVRQAAEERAAKKTSGEWPDDSPF